VNKLPKFFQHGWK